MLLPFVLLPLLLNEKWPLLSDSQSTFLMYRVQVVLILGQVHVY